MNKLIHLMTLQKLLMLSEKMINESIDPVKMFFMITILNSLMNAIKLLKYMMEKEDMI